MFTLTPYWTRTQVKYSPTEHLKEEWKNGVRSISLEKKRVTSPNKDKVYWRTQTDGVIRQPSSRNTTSPEKGRELTKTVRL